MKIGILSPAYELGGASKVATYIGNLLSNEGNEVFFISYLESNKPDVSALYYDLFSKKNIVLRYFNKLTKYLEFKKNGYFSPSDYMKKEINLLEKIINIEKPDILIMNTFIPSVIFSSFIKSNFPNIKIITWMHSDPEYSLNHIAKFYKKEFKASFKNVDKVICLSEKVKEVLIQYGADAEVIYNPMVLNQKGVSELTEKVISYTARLDIKVKGIDYLCKVANFLPEEWTIRVAGDGTTQEVKKFMSLIKENKVENKINFVGPLMGNKLVEHYVNSSIFISTSRTEGLPLVMIEAISYGLPIISFNHNGGKEILDNGEFGILVSNNDVVKMGKEINNLIKNKSKLKSFQALSLKRSEEFKTERIIQKWNLLFEKLFSEEK